jgi:hypothetical protein
MSIIDTSNHSVVSYDPKVTKAFEGQRLSKVQYKTVSNKDDPMFGIKRPSMCVSIPMVKTEDVIANAQVLASHVVVMLHGVQDKMIKERIEAGAKSIGNEEISIGSILEWLEVNNDSGRITKESVASWFASEIADNLMVVLADKMGIGEDGGTREQVEQVEKAVKAFEGRKTSYEPKVAEGLKKCLRLANEGESDVMAQRFMARLDKMIESAKENENMIDLL